MLRTRYPAGRRAWLTTMLGLVAAGIGLVLFGQPRARAADVEIRTFSIQIDGKKSGDYQMTINHQDDGAVSLSTQSDVRVTLLAIPVYTYNYRAVEIWKNGRLQHFESNGKEKGKEFSVRADAAGANLHVVANGQEHSAPADVWTTSCWCLPAPGFRNNNVTLLGCDNGNVKVSQLQYIGTDQVKVAGQMQGCAHYRVTKDAPHDLWYDAQERLVRDEWLSDGHRTVLELTGVQH
jgi:hypothetical protein